MNKNVPAYLTTRPGPVAVARCTECGVLTLQPTRPFLDRGGVFSDGCGDCPPATHHPTLAHHLPALALMMMDSALSSLLQATA